MAPNHPFSCNYVIIQEEHNAMSRRHQTSLTGAALSGMFLKDGPHTSVILRPFLEKFEGTVDATIDNDDNFSGIAIIQHWFENIHQ
jgi:hypothetical protein